MRAAKVLSIGLWGPGLGLLVAAAAVPGLAILLLVPVGAFLYAVFSLIAFTGDRNVG